MKFITAFTLMTSLMVPLSSYGVTIEEDIATMLILKGFDCGGKAVKTINSDTTNEAGNRNVNATCPNGNNFNISVSKKGKISVTKL